MHFVGRFASIAAVTILLGGCATYQYVKELKLVGFEEDVGKGKTIGSIEGGDCVFHILGYWLGGQPTLSKAFSNARKQMTSSLTDVAGGESAKGDPVRYMNNVTVRNDGFNAGVFGKSCIIVSGAAYK